MRRSKDMHDIQELIRLHRLGVPVRKAGAQLAISPNAHLGYRTKLAAAGLLAGDPTKLPSLAQIRAIIPMKLPPQQVSSAQEHLEEIHRRARAGQAPRVVFDHITLRCRAEDKAAPSYDAVKRAIRSFERAKPVDPSDVVIPVVTRPGDVAQVDFGYVGLVVDGATGDERKAWVFVLVLGHSRHLFARVVFDQTVATWTDLHVQAFRFFGGVPATIVPDNLKAAVVRASFRTDADPGIQRTYRDLARHYGFQIDPAPVRAPQKKGKVERGVDYVQRFLSGFDRGTNLDTLNRALDSWNDDVASVRTHGTTGRVPIEVFWDEEQKVLGALPPTSFTITTWKQAQIGPSFHVRWRCQWWSAPWHLVGKEAWIEASELCVRLYVDDVVVAEHDGRDRRSYVTDPAHAPDVRSEYAERSVEAWLERADRLHGDVGTWLRELVVDVLSPLRRFLGIVLFLESVELQRIPGIVARARRFGLTRVGELRGVVSTGLDRVDLPETSMISDLPPTPTYHRAVATLFLAHQEATLADLH
jgi:transposase